MPMFTHRKVCLDFVHSNLAMLMGITENPCAGVSAADMLFQSRGYLPASDPPSVRVWKVSLLVRCNVRWYPLWVQRLKCTASIGVHRCVYHAWQFDKSGKCVKIPQSERRGRDEQNPMACATAYPTKVMAESGGIVLTGTAEFLLEWFVQYVVISPRSREFSRSSAPHDEGESTTWTFLLFELLMIPCGDKDTVRGLSLRCCPCVTCDFGIGRYFRMNERVSSGEARELGTALCSRIVPGGLPRIVRLMLIVCWSNTLACKFLKKKNRFIRAQYFFHHRAIGTHSGSGTSLQCACVLNVTKYLLVFMSWLSSLYHHAPSILQMKLSITDASLGCSLFRWRFLCRYFTPSHRLSGGHTLRLHERSIAGE